MKSHFNISFFFHFHKYQIYLKLENQYQAIVKNLQNPIQLNLSWISYIQKAYEMSVNFFFQVLH